MTQLGLLYILVVVVIPENVATLVDTMLQFCKCLEFVLNRSFPHFRVCCWTFNVIRLRGTMG